MSPRTPSRSPSSRSASCDLHAIAKLDRIFLGGRFVNPAYEARRGRVFVVAVNCGVAGGTCFCVSMGTGPRATFGYDVVLTELMEDGRRGYLADAASDRGAELLRASPLARQPPRKWPKATGSWSGPQHRWAGSSTPPACPSFWR